MKTILQQGRRTTKKQAHACFLHRLLVITTMLTLCLVLTPGMPRDYLAEGAEETIDDYVLLLNEFTDLGVRYIPNIINDAILDNPAVRDFLAKFDAALAEQEENLETTIAMYEEEGVELPSVQNNILFDYCATLQDDIFSLAVRYTPLTVKEPINYRLFSVNLDLKTGKALSLEELLDRAGFTWDDVDFSIRVITRHFMAQSQMIMFLNEAKTAGTAPDFTKFPKASLNVVETTMEESLNSFHAGLEGKPDAIGVVPDPPAMVYQGADRLLVSAPVGTWVGHFMTMIPLVRTGDEALALAGWDCFGNTLLGFGVLQPETALVAAQRMFSVDEQGLTPDGTKLSFVLESMCESPYDESNEGPCYTVAVYKEPEHTLYDTRYISSKTGAIWEKDPLTAWWYYVDADVALFDEDPVASSRDQEAAGVLLTQLDAYEEWISRPHFTASISHVMDLEPNNDMLDASLNCLITVAEDDSIITVEQDYSEVKQGDKDPVVYKERLHTGESLLIVYPASDDADLTVRICNKQGTSSLNLADLKTAPDRQVYLKY